MGESWWNSAPQYPEQWPTVGNSWLNWSFKDWSIGGRRAKPVGHVCVSRDGQWGESLFLLTDSFQMWQKTETVHALFQNNHNCLSALQNSVEIWQNLKRQVSLDLICLAYGAISGFWVMHICMLYKTFLPFWSWFHVCTSIPSGVISKKANNAFIGYFWEKAIFHWMQCFRSSPFTFNWPHPLLFQNGVFLVASREKVSLTSLLHLQLTLYT